MYFKHACLLFAGVAASCGSQAFAQTQHVALRDNTLTALPDAMRPFLNTDKATIGGVGDAKNILSIALAPANAAGYYSNDRKPKWTAADLDKPDYYCVIQVVKWKDQKNVDAQNWYVYSGRKGWAQDDFTSNKRIFGAKNVALLFIHLNRSADYTTEYDIDATKKLPAPVLHLFQAAGAFGALAEFNGTPDVFGFADANISYVPSDLTFSGYTSTSPGSSASISNSFVVDNEGTYFWDVSVAVPIRKISQLQFNNTNNTVTANNVDKNSVFTVLDLYPFKKDVKATTPYWRPYGLAGIAVAQQPLHKVLVGAGFGAPFAQFYFGAVFVKQDSLTGLSENSMATPAQQAAATSQRFKPQFAFGINLPVREVFQAATGKTGN